MHSQSRVAAMPQASFPQRTEKKWTDVHEHYKTTGVIGQGTYGIVYKGERRNDPTEEVALKRARLDAFTDYGIPETALREVTILRDLKHENIMRVAEISCSTSRMYMVCEYLEMDLKKFIRSHNRAIPRQIVKQITYEILKGLAFSHAHRVMHRDLKPHNILLSKEGDRVKLADFGLARPKHTPSKTITHDVVTLWYRAPELLLGECKYGDAIDLWSVGCIVAEMMSGKAPFPGDSEIDTLLRIFRLLGTPTASEWPQGALDPLSQFPVFAKKSHPFAAHISNLDHKAEDLLMKLMLYDPKERITARAAMDHPWFDDIRPAPRPEPATSAASSAISSAAASPRTIFGKTSGQRVVPKNVDSGTTNASTTASDRKLSATTSSSTNTSSPVGAATKPSETSDQAANPDSAVGKVRTWWRWNRRPRSKTCSNTGRSNCGNTLTVESLNERRDTRGSKIAATASGAMTLDYGDGRIRTNTRPMTSEGREPDDLEIGDRQCDASEISERCRLSVLPENAGEGVHAKVRSSNRLYEAARSVADNSRWRESNQGVPAACGVAHVWQGESSSGVEGVTSQTCGIGVGRRGHQRVNTFSDYRGIRDVEKQTSVGLRGEKRRRSDEGSAQDAINALRKCGEVTVVPDENVNVENQPHLASDRREVFGGKYNVSRSADPQEFGVFGVVSSSTSSSGELARDSESSSASSSGLSKDDEHVDWMVPEIVKDIAAPGGVSPATAMYGAPQGRFSIP